MSGDTSLPIAYAVLQIWSESLNVDEMTELLGIEPSTWTTDGQVVEEGKPPHFGYQWILTSTESEPVAAIVGKLSAKTDGVRDLLSRGAKAVLYCHYRPVPDCGLPALTVKESKLIADLGIDVALMQKDAKMHPAARTT